jgi:hypothetical protein
MITTCDFSNYVCPSCHFDVGHEMDRRRWIRQCDFEVSETTLKLTVVGNGPGAELSKLLSRLGISASDNCPCKERAREMDRQGTAWCRENMATILGWLREEAERRGLPYSETLATLVVKLAIRNAEKAEKARDSQSAAAPDILPLAQVAAGNADGEAFTPIPAIFA